VANKRDRAAVEAEATTRWSVWREYAEALVMAVLLALFIRTFVVQAFKIPSGSMKPTLEIGDHLLVNKFIYGLRVPFVGARVFDFNSPQREDVIVFVYPQDPSKDFIKRVKALPGERVEIRNKQVYINGERLEDPYGYFEDTSGSMRNPRDNLRSFVVPEGHVFVMGDNRDYSHDSRFWGPVPIDDILGKAFILYWSWDAKEFRPRWGRLGMRIPD
jgi:signal peptidase I